MIFTRKNCINIKNGRFLLLYILVMQFLILSPKAAAQTLGDQAERFQDTEIRVIRPRYFNKSKRIELGGGVSTILNETFIYTFMASGLAAFHFNEEWALEGSLSVGFSINKEDKRILFDEFDIKTQIFRTLYNTELAVQYTPMYGKWQLSSGKLVYFDTFFIAGVGTTGIDWRYNDFCDPPNPDSDFAEPVPTNVVKPYPTFMIGAGQRYFVSKTLSYRLDFRIHRFFYNTLDTECSPKQVEESGDFIDSAAHDTITLQLGTSVYF
ncbi:MAG: outer membrane beta-barrel domain-containing protein [Oligoflexus sp.]